MKHIHEISSKELDRATMLQRIINKTITQKDVALSLGLSDRQVRRMLVKYRAEGTAGLVNKARGKPSHNRLSQTVKDQAIELVRTQYPDFGPTLAAEKLAERDSLNINHETLRGLMIKANIWEHKERKATHRMRRERRACYGDMEQFDGCRHDWFEGRLPGGAWATLLASRDDANNMVYARFLGYEGTRPVMAYWQDYFKAYGKPIAIYLDRHSTYKVNSKNALDDDQMITQFERAMKQLNVEVIHANSPQAKGRIENLFGTLQDRLVKDLRLAEINDVAAANVFLRDIFLPAYNTRFCVTPASEIDVHRPLRTNDHLTSVMSVISTRYINEDFTIRFKNSWLQLTKVQPTLVLPKSQVTIEERLDNSIHLRLNNQYLTYTKLSDKPLITGKPPIALTSNPHPPTIPGPNHPWRKIVLLPYNITNRPNQKRPSRRIT
ncbi:MAG: ISNCY family transposase [Mycobacteriales bacterium]